MTPGELEVDGKFLARQYADSENFRVRVETHRVYSERRTDTFTGWLLHQLAAPAGCMLADIGCGPGNYHPPLARHGVRIAAIDASAGMVAEAIGQAARENFALDAAAASAERLPFRDAMFDRVMANHMLYHVADQPRALAEMRRILKPGGRIVLATNAPNDIAPLYRAHTAAARALGFTPAAPDPLRFNMNHLALVQTAFPSAEARIRQDALIFHEAEPAARYYASYLVDSIDDRPADESHREPLIAEFRARVEAIIRSEGVFRVPKGAGCFVADV